MKGARTSNLHNSLKFPNLFYDYNNNHQIQHPVSSLNTQRRFIPLNSDQLQNGQQNKGQNFLRYKVFENTN